MISPPIRITIAAFTLAAALFMVPAHKAVAQTNYYSANGTEYPVIGPLAGDQVFPDAAVSTTGGYVVWQDNITDGSGWGVSARRLDATLSGTLSTFRVNQQATGDQENPRVALLKNGGAVFVWQGGMEGFQHIYARFLTPTNTFLTTNDILVNTFTNNFQINPAVATLANGNVVVVWGSYNEAGSNSLQDVYGQLLSPAGQKIGAEFLINQFTGFNQRTPAVAALTNGGFVVAWVSEQQRSTAPNWGTNSTYYGSSSLALPSVDIYARIFNAGGTSGANEFLVNTTNNIAANPAIASLTDGTFIVTWGEKDISAPANGWDVCARSFFLDGTGNAAVRVNSHVAGDQYAPHISSLGIDCLVTWTSLGQDGSREGVFGQFIRTGAAVVGNEFRVNTTTISQQMHPVVASDGTQQFIVLWTGYTGSPYNFDLFAERYSNVAALLQAMSPPYVHAPFVVINNVYQPQLQVTWPLLLGISVSNYEVYVDGAALPSGVTTSNQWTMKAANGLAAGTVHTFQLAYVTTDGRRAPLSPPASGTTWSGCKYAGMPCEWMDANYPSGIWPQPNDDTDHDGMTTLQEFLSGTDPNNAASVLKVQLTKTAQGMFLNWPTQPGLTYQVQTTTNFATWINSGEPRFANGFTDSLYVGGNPAAYYRIVLLR